MLIEKAHSELLITLFAKTVTLHAHKHFITQFEELCAVLRHQGISFCESLDVKVDRLEYHIKPANHGDYLAIVDALFEMGATRIPADWDANHDTCDFINPAPDAPAFWLTVPLTN